MLQETTNDNIQPDFIHRVVSIPPKYVDRPDDPDGHAECIITTDDEKRLFDCPPFLTERVPHAKPDTITIKESATGGLGMFATRDIAYAELLVAERPLLVAPGVHRSDFHLGKCRTLEEHIKNMSLEREQQLESAFERMDDEKKEAYMALASSIKKDGLLSGIHQTNAFRLDLNELTKYGGMVPESEELRRGLMPQELNMYSFVVKTASRLNHRWLLILIHFRPYSSYITAALRTPNWTSPWARSPSSSTHRVISKPGRRYSFPTPTSIYPPLSVTGDSRGTASPASAPHACALHPSRTSSAKPQPPK